MPEEYLAVDGLEFNYKGLFDFKDLLRYIKRIFNQHGYRVIEKEKEAKIKSAGKDFYIEFLAEKEKTKFEKLTIILKLNITNMINTTVIVDSKTRKLNQADITAIFDAWLITDFKGRWTAPWYFFLKTLFRHGFTKIGERFEDELINDTNTICENLKAHLNLHRFVEVKPKKKLTKEQQEQGDKQATSKA